MKAFLVLGRLLSVILMFLMQNGSTGMSQKEAADIPFPEGYEQTYTNYLSLDRVQNHDQIIRLFGNETAMGGVDENGELPYGSILVGEVYTAKKDAEGNVLTSSLGRRIKDQLVLIAVMQKEEGWGEEYSEELKNGNWDFAAFKPDGKVADKNLDACRACHAPLAAEDHVFSIEHINQ